MDKPLIFKEKIILWDSEYTSWAECKSQNWDPKKNQFREIIQIGAVIVNTTTWEIEDEFLAYAKPLKNPILSDFIKELTHVSQESVDNANSFEVVWDDFVSFAKGYPLFSFGDDAAVVQENLLFNSIPSYLKVKNAHNLRTVLETLGYKTDGFSSSNFLTQFDLVNPNHTHDALADAKALHSALKHIFS